MGKLNVKVREDIDAKFRRAVFRKKGMKKGNLTTAVEEAMLLWISAPSKPSEDKSEGAQNLKDDRV
jgi:hypothetical protein